jgi:hypothetical protein
VERVAPFSAPVVLRLDHGANGRGWFVATGDHFILAVQHPETGVEVSYGRRHHEGWNGTILASTTPWRQGRSAFEDGAPPEDWTELPP